MSDSGDSTAPEQWWTPTQGQTQGVFDPTQVAWSAAPNYEGMPTEYYDNSGNMIGYLGHGDNVMSTQGLNFVDPYGNPTSVSDKHSLYQLTDEQGNLLYNNPNYDGGGDMWTTQNNGLPATRQLSGMINMNAPSPGILQDPLFRNFMLSAGAMGAGAALAPAAGALGGAEAFPVALGDSITMSPFAAEAGSLTAGITPEMVAGWEAGLPAAEGLTDAEAAALMGEYGTESGLTAPDLLKYGKMGLSGLSALNSVANAAGKIAGSGALGGGSGGADGSSGSGGSGSTSYASPVQKVSGQYLSTGQASDKPFEIKKLEMLHPQANQIDPQILNILANKGSINHSYGDQTTTAKPSSGYPELSLNSSGDIVGYAMGGEVESQGWMYDHPTHVAEFKTGTTGHHVQGAGDGQSDDIPAMLADGEYVFDADTVAALGNGSNKAGAGVLDKFREALREHKRSAPADKIPPKAAPLTYLKQALKD